MESPKLGSDPSDYLSKPINERQTKLAKVFEIPVRRNPEKPGRELIVIWDERNPLVEGFENRYCYLVSFADKGNIAGNHYHQHKQELFTPATGSFTVLLEDIESKEQESLILNTGQVLYIPPRIAHKVISNSPTAILLVTATYPNNDEDEFPYQISK